MRALFFILSLCILLAALSGARANSLPNIEKAAFNPGFCCSTTPTTNPTFTALHTYYISPTGSDSNSGTSSGSPWLTPNHAVVCGDVIIAATGAYSSGNFDSFSAGTTKWGAVSGCPSTSGGIDGTGGVYVANVVCATAFACTINSTTTFAVDISASNWAMTGWSATNTANSDGDCFVARPISTATIGYIAFINDIASTCPLAGVSANNNTGSSTFSVDEFAAVGDIAWNSSGSNSECGSGFTINTPSNLDSFAGTHIFFSQDFSYGNIDGACSPNVEFNGQFNTANGAVSSGTTLVLNTTPSNWGANWPIVANTGGGAAVSPAILTWPSTTPALVSSLAGNTVTLTQGITTPGISNGQQITIGVTTDGEGLIFDTWEPNAYTGQSVVENNLFWENGGPGFIVLCGSGCPSGLSVYVFNNTMYGNVHDYKHDGPSGGLLLNQDQTGTFSITNNLIQEDVTQPQYSLTEAAWNGTTGVGAAGTGQPVVGLLSNNNQAGITISGNWIASASGASCVSGLVCDSGHNLAAPSGSTFASGNTLGTSPAFASPGSLPRGTAPSCSSYSTTVACMASVIADLTPSASGTSGKGYQAPGPCTADAYYPTWLKGVVYLQLNGSTLTENAGLVTKPCGL